MDVPKQQKCFIFFSFLPCGHRFMAQLGCLRAWLEQSFYSTSKFIESEFTVGLCPLLSQFYVSALLPEEPPTTQGKWVTLLGVEQVLCPVLGDAETALGVLVSHQ